MKSNVATKLAPLASAPTEGKEQDSDGAPAQASLPKTMLLPTGLSRAMVLSSILLLITASVIGLLGNRYALFPVPNSPNAMAYRLDRLTGGVSFCTSVQCSPVSSKTD